MIGTIRRHSKWLWLVIATATIIAFVYWGAQGSRNGGSGSGGSGNFGSISGRRISSEAFLKARREFFIRYLFNAGDWPDSDARRTGVDLERETYIWLFLVSKMDEMGIHVSTDTAAQIARQKLATFGRGKAISMEDFSKQILAQKGLTAEDFASYIQHEQGLQELITSVGAGGRLVTEVEIRALYEREHQERAVQAVFFNAADYLDMAVVTPETVGQFYTNQAANYRIEERVQVSFVGFATSNFMAEATGEVESSTNLSGAIDYYYEQLGGTNYFNEAKSVAEAKVKVRELMIDNGARAFARKKANDFAAEVFTNANAGALAAVAKARGLESSVSAPFTKSAGPADLNVHADFAKAAFALNEAEPFAGPILGEKAVYVIAFNKRLPSELPSLDAIREKVTADCKLTTAANLARNIGDTFAKTAAESLEKGKTFSSLANDAKLRVVRPPPVALSTTNAFPEVVAHATMYDFKRAAFTPAPGRLSPFVATRDGGLVVFVQSTMPMDTARMNAALPRFAESVRQARVNEAFNEWFNREASTALRDTPLMQKQDEERRKAAAGK